jgi:hypothetical protein
MRVTEEKEESRNEMNCTAVQSLPNRTVKQKAA